MAFALARRFREPLVRKFASLKKIHEWERMLSEKEQFWSWVVLRLPSNFVFDYISYAAGLTNCSYRMFITSSIIGNLPTVLAFYLISGYAYEKGGWLYGILAAVGVLIFIYMSFKIYRRLKKISPQV